MVSDHDHEDNCSPKINIEKCHNVSPMNNQKEREREAERTSTERPKIGIGVIVIKDKKILVGKRRSAHGEGTWSPPGGHLEFGETWENCARRETREETGIEIKDVEFFAVTNDIKEETHYVTIFMKCLSASGIVKNLEPDKCECWKWFPWEELPRPLFQPLETIVQRGLHPQATHHNKLVRDFIPRIIQKNHDVPITYHADMNEYHERLKMKLVEEVQEYLESDREEELADILEVIHALTALKGIPREQLQKIQKEKRDSRGGFTQRIILKETKPGNKH
jgi:8-oxo-dGTP diphosphatase